MRPAPIAVTTGIVTGLAGAALLAGGGAIAAVILAAAQATFWTVAIAVWIRSRPRRPAG